MRERRNRIQLAIEGEANYKIKGSFRPPVTVLINEISDTGLLFISPEILQEGDILEMSIKVINAFEPIPTIGKVLWQRKSSSKLLYETCVRFVSVDENKEKELLNLIGKLVRKIGMNRSHVRCRFDSLIKYKKVGDPNEHICAGVDISILGMKVILPEMLDINQNLKTWFKLPKDTNLILVQARITWKGTLNEGKCPTGLRFINLSDEDKAKIIEYIKSQMIFGDAEGKTDNA